MSCEEIEALLGAYRDGELGDEQRALVTAELDTCERCQGAYADLSTLSAVVTRAVIEPAAAADLSGFADTVMERIERDVRDAVAPASAQSREPVGLLDQLASMLGLDARSLVMAGALGAAALAWGLWPTAPKVNPQAVRAAEAAPDAPPAAKTPLPRRSMEMETASMGRNAASVETVEVAHGRIVIDDNADDPDRPVIVWHILGDAVEQQVDAAP